MGYKAKILNYQNPYIARLYRKGIHIDFWKRDILPSRWGKVFHEVGENLYGLKEWKNQWTSFEKFDYLEQVPITVIERNPEYFTGDSYFQKGCRG